MNGDARNVLSGTAASVAVAALSFGCAESAPPAARVAAQERPQVAGQALVLAMASFEDDADGAPKPLPARAGILVERDGAWSYGWIEDPASNVFHKAMAYRPAQGPSGLLTLGGTGASVKLWSADGTTTLWEADFGGEFSRMRDAEVGDLYGDGRAAIAVATHDQGVVAVLRPDGAGGFSVHELDREPGTVVHEIELGDLDGDGVLEVYATPSAPNRVDGTPQPGKVVRYVPARGRDRAVVADLGKRHAKEILAGDIDGDGTQELYVAVEGISEGQVEILRYDDGTDPDEGTRVAKLPDKLCRFLTAGDVDGDGRREIVAATHKRGIWLIRPGSGEWPIELIDRDSSSFEHASILLDLDGDRRDELYVASDDQGEVRRYAWSSGGWDKAVLMKHPKGTARFTWNIMPVPPELLPAVTFAAVDAPEVEPQETRGLVLNTPAASPGYVLFAPLLSGTTYLIDTEGKVVHTWDTDLAPGGSVYLLDNGHLLRTAREPDVPVFKGGGQGGRIREFTWENELVWDFTLATEERLLHHDIRKLPNGNVLAIAWERKSAEEALRAGRRPDLVPEKGLWPDLVLEIEPVLPDGGRIVWEWHAWDHLVQDHDPDAPNYGAIADAPHRIDVNGSVPEPMDDKELERLKALGYMPAGATHDDRASDLLHTNSVDYNAALDQVVLSVPRFDEIWIIDHGTTTEEAAGSSGGRRGRGGDLLYRWGNPKACGRGAESDQQLFAQHDARWIPEGLPGAGRIMVFNNDAGAKDAKHSIVFELAPPLDAEGRYVLEPGRPWGPAQPQWRYEAPDRTSFHAPFISGAHRLANGNTFICQGPAGRFFEVTPQGEVVWEYKSIYSGNIRNPDGSPPHPVGKATHAAFRATKIPPDHPALAGRTLRPLDPQPPIVLPSGR
jgi:hypothetical protein